MVLSGKMPSYICKTDPTMNSSLIGISYLVKQPAALFPKFCRAGDVRRNACRHPSRQPGRRLSEKIGNSSDKPIVPTTTPITQIMSGSIRLVAVLSDVSTSRS